MEQDPELKALIDAPIATRWIGESDAPFLLACTSARTEPRSETPPGPDAHVVAYPIKAQNAFNIVTTHISNTVGLTEDWTARASKEIMLKRFEGWTETLLKCLRLAPPGELVEWALRIHLPLTGWIDGNTVLLADAAHATLPHIAQGAAQAGEDAAVLSTLLAKCQTKEEVPAALQMYEKLRKPRADWAVEMARITGALPFSSEEVVSPAHFSRGLYRREPPHGGRCCSKGARRGTQASGGGRQVARPLGRQGDAAPPLRPRRRQAGRPGIRPPLNLLSLLTPLF